MSKIHCYTSISFSYLDRARVLAATIRRIHPDWVIWLCLSDQEPDGFHFDIEAEQFDHVVRAWELKTPPYLPWVFEHDVVELCTAVKGTMLEHIFSSGADRVIYLDPDCAVFSPLDSVLELLDTQSVVLTPHLLSPEQSRMGILDNEISCLLHGTYNLGFVAVRNTQDGLAFAAWWAERLRQFCRADVQSGLFTDQRWCDLAPALFNGVAVLRDPGYNVASWNLSNRPISFDAGGRIYAADKPLCFFHFSKVNSVGESMLQRYSHGRTEVFELLRWYREQLELHKTEGLPANWWHYGTYGDGVPIPRSHRALWRDRDDVRRAFADPFAIGSNCYRDWASATLASGHAA